MSRPILFASSSLETSHEPVRQALESRGARVVVFPIDRVMTGDTAFSLLVDQEGSLAVSCAGSPVGPQDIGAAWYWKPLSFSLPDAQTNIAKQLSMVNEITRLDNSVWGLYPDALWLNSPTSTWLANQKLPQLVLAQELGFIVPRTLVSNSWDDVTRQMEGNDAQELIAKMHRGVLASHNEVRAAYSTRLDKSKIASLRTTTLPFPGIIQPFIPKRREWRITVVGERTFSAAIYTSDEARNDWRQHQLDPRRVRFEAAEAPADVRAKCRNFLVRSSLGYGAFDLIESPDGAFHFLECNPSGQFAWLDEACALGIADAIADELLAIAG